MTRLRGSGCAPAVHLLVHASPNCLPFAVGIAANHGAWLAAPPKPVLWPGALGLAHTPHDVQAGHPSRESEPCCVLDFYVHESCQRMGVGHALFQVGELSG